MNGYVITGIFGLVSGFIAALADVPLVMPGKNSDQVPGGKVQKWWSEVPEKRFTVSFWLSFLGQPGTYLTMWMLAALISKNNSGLGLALKINTFIGCYTGLLCHVIYCMKPLVYQKIYKKLSNAEIEDAVGVLDKVTVVPMILGFSTLWLGTTVMVAIAVLNGSIEVPKLCLLLNPITSTIFLLLLKKLKVKIIGALGTGFMMFATLLIIAGLQMS